MEANIKGHQRKVVRSEVRPVKMSHGESGIALKNGQTLPFVVTRFWNAPEGYYPEQWFLVKPDTREVIYESPARTKLIWGLQSLTEVSDEVDLALRLRPGPYLVVFALGGVKGDEIEVEAAEVPGEQAA